MQAWVVVILIAVAACSSGPGAPESGGDYVKEVESARQIRQRYMREDPESPVPPEKRNVLLPLRYYAPDPSFRVPAVLQLSDNRPVFEMPTSTGTIRKMQLVGSLEFTLKGQPMRLGAFVENGTQKIETLFVPFADQTTGKETYSAGRYLDLHPTATGLYTIDFNDAYNPSCAYSERYECPYPPPSNRLKLEITAGEKAPAA